MATGCRRHKEDKSSRVPSDVLAVVGTSEIHVGDFRREVERRHAEGLAVDDAHSLLKELVERRLLVERARELGLEHDPEVRRSYENLLIGKLRARELQPLLQNVTVTDAEVREYYEKNRDEFAVAARIRPAILVRHVTDRNREKVRKAMLAVRQKAASLPIGTRGFGTLAIGNSEDQVSRYRGGDVGWLTIAKPPPRWPGAVLQAAAALEKPGDLSELIETQKNIYLLRLIARKAASVKSLKEVAPVIRRRLLQDKKRSIEEKFLAGVRAGVEVRIDERALEHAVAPWRQKSRNGKTSGPPSLPGQ